MARLDNTDALLRVLAAPRRNHFFYGKRMDVQHFEMEQAYGKLKGWLRNRLALGKGVLCGLGVSIDGDRVCVDPGVAIDGLGREIIVPVRACIDPLAPDDGCCGQQQPTGVAEASGVSPAGSPVAPAAAGAATTSASTRPTNGLFTLWVCSRECLADQQPVEVSDCGTRAQCAAGTVVETFCLKATPGLPPLQGDPDWCANLWAEDGMSSGGAGPAGSPGALAATHVEFLPASAAGGSVSDALGLTAADVASIKAAMDSRRHVLCELFDGTCEAPADDACVPLALILLVDGKMRIESCLVRPRIYSNARLLDLILCLAEKIDDCCNKQPPTLLKVKSIDFLSRSAVTNAETVVGSVQSPLQDTAVAASKKANAIRIRFNQPLASDQHQPTTAGVNDPDFKIHNVQILPYDTLKNVFYVPGILTVEDPATVRFDLSPESPYSVRGAWRPGRYRLFLRGNEDLSLNFQALADQSDVALDGEAIAPANGVISGNGSAGGDFNTYFVVTPDAVEQQTLRVQAVEFMTAPRGGSVITTVANPLESTTVKYRDGLHSIRVTFTKDLDATDHQPTTPSSTVTDYLKYNWQVLRLDDKGTVQGCVPGLLSVVAKNQIVFSFGSTLTNIRGPLPWPAGRYRLFLRGSEDTAQGYLAIEDVAKTPLDGEPSPLTAGAISGDGTPGGDFTVEFTVLAAA